MKSIGDKINNKRITGIGYLDGTELFYDLEDGSMILEKKLKNNEESVDLE